MSMMMHRAAKRIHSAEQPPKDIDKPVEAEQVEAENGADETPVRRGRKPKR